MKSLRLLLFLFLACFSITVKSQAAFDSVQFFLDEQPLNITLTTDMGAILYRKIKDGPQDATFSCVLPDSTVVTEAIRIQARGHMRRTICDIPPLKFNFKNPTSPRLSCLNSLKLVNCCRFRSSDEQFLLKEFLIYKMYNLLTEKSFRARLVNITYEDVNKKKDPVKKFGFFIEDVDALAKRNKCKELDSVKLHPEAIDRDQMTMVALFEYMIGNTDWSVPNNHNIKLLTPKKDKTIKPYPVPYDFDHSGLVNTDYAAPDEIMGIETVVERLYRGFPRTMEELQPAVVVYNNQKEKIYALVQNFEALKSPMRKSIIRYLDDFYSIINDPKSVQVIFIDRARKS